MPVESNRFKCIAWLLAGLLSLACTGVPTSEVGIPPNLDSEIVAGEAGRRIDDFLNRSEEFGFSGSVLITRDAEILLHKGYGLAHRQKSIVNAPDTIHSVESITKPFTAIAILMLAEEGRLSVDDRVGDWFDRAPADKADLTLSQLLSHTSGLPGEYEPSRKDLDRDAVAEEILALELEVDPGAEWHYSNPGFILLAIVVELASGSRYDRFVTERILDPVGMADSGFIGGDRSIDRARLAHPYNREIDAGSPLDWTGGYAGYWGAGGLLASTADLYRWIFAFERGQILPPTTREEMIAPRIGVFEGWSYGYGIFYARTDRGSHFIRHGGNRSPAGVTTELRHYLDENVVMILAVNSMIDEVGLTRAVRSEILALLFGGEVVWPPETGVVSAEQREELAGTYELPGGALDIEDTGQGFVARTASQEVFNRLKAHSQQEVVQLQAVLEASSRIAADRRVPKQGARADEYRIGLAESLPGGLTTVYVEIQTPHGVSLERWVWEETELLFTLPSTRGPEVVLQPVSDRELATWDLLRRRGARLELVEADTGDLRVEVVADPRLEPGSTGVH